MKPCPHPHQGLDQDHCFVAAATTMRIWAFDVVVVVAAVEDVAAAARGTRGRCASSAPTTPVWW